MKENNRVRRPGGQSHVNLGIYDTRIEEVHIFSGLVGRIVRSKFENEEMKPQAGCGIVFDAVWVWPSIHQARVAYSLN